MGHGRSPAIARGSIGRPPQPTLAWLEGTKRELALHADGWHGMHLHARIAGDEIVG